jgi:endonuclease YncB( thermonuclease family)
MFLQTVLPSLILLASGWPATDAVAAEMLAGPYVGAVERVVDGDTIAVRVSVWLEQDLHVLVRVRGIDAPEVHGRCTSERERAGSATAELERLVAGGAVVLTRIEGDKYYGRVLADVTTPKGEDVGRSLVAGGYARPYDGHQRGPWCEAGADADAGQNVAAAKD